MVLNTKEEEILRLMINVETAKNDLAKVKEEERTKILPFAEAEIAARLALKNANETIVASKE